MRLLVVNQEVQASVYGQTYHLKPPGDPRAGLRDVLVADEGGAAELLRRHGNVLSSADLAHDDGNRLPTPLAPDQEIPPNCKILILRTGGIGDHIMLLPALKAFRASRCREHRGEIWLATQREMFPIFHDEPSIDRLRPLPLPLDEAAEADFFVDISQGVTPSDFSTRHPTEVYMKILGVSADVSQDLIPTLTYHPNPFSESAHRLAELKRSVGDRSLVLLQWQASVQMRRLPPHKFARLAHECPECVFFVAHHRAVAEETEAEIHAAGIRALNVSHDMHELDDFIGAVLAADAVVSTDSSGYHLAGALNKPSLALFGPIASNQRCVHYPLALALDADYRGRECRSPCGHHKGVCPEGEYLGSEYSPCLLSMPETAILEKFQELQDRHMGLPPQ
jgi:ADP-heptose:LPS heptosyltransferase